MKKTAIAITLALLVSSVAGTLLFEVVQANFVPTSPDTIPPIVSILSPTNNTYENEVLLHFNITAVAAYQELNYAAYTLDGQETVICKDYGLNDLNWSTTLEGLKEGAHSLKVTASLKSYYATPTSGGALYYRTYWGNSDMVYFYFLFPPQISILSPKNETYTAEGIQLDFTVNEQVSEVEFSLDEKANVTISGNTTLTGLTVGVHNLILFANDADGNLGASETITFTVEEPFPTTLVIGSIIAVVAMIGLGLLVHIKKRGRRPENKA
jgi:hypothetical protein